MNSIEESVQLFEQGYVCSQAVFAAFCQDFGLEKDMALKIGACFGSGMRKGQVCGALTGALMVLGLLYGQKKAGDTEGRQKSNEVNDLMMNRFKEKCGSCLCNDLLGCDVSTKEGVQYCLDNKLFTEFCPKMVAAAVDIIEGINQMAEIAPFDLT